MPITIIVRVAGFLHIGDHDSRDNERAPPSQSKPVPFANSQQPASKQPL